MSSHACSEHDGGCCSHSSAVPSVHQTLDEMEFERGIWFAALNGDIKRVRFHMEKGLDPGAKDNAGYTALHYAARSGHKDVCSLLLERGVDANVQTHGGATPLHRAAIQGHLDVVQLLLKYQADPLITDSDGKTALHKAAEGGYKEVIEELLKYNKNLLNVLDKQGRSPVECLPPDKSELVEVMR